MMSLLLYIVGLAILCAGMYFVRKSDEKLNAVTYLIFTVVLFMIVQAVEAGIINRIPAVPINAAVFGVLHIVEGAALWYVIIAKKYRQVYYFEIADVRALAVLAVFVVVAAVRQFGVHFDNFNFEADSDAARHLMYARSVSDQGQLISMYFSAVNSGLIMNAFKGIVNEILMYKVFIMFEIAILYLNGAMFWTLIRRYLNNRVSIIVGIVVATAYMLGYPWNSMVFGSSYLSTGIMCVAMIIFLLDLFYNDIFCSKKVTLVLLIISCYSVFVSYLLFVPPVLGIIALAVFLKWIIEKRMSRKQISVLAISVITILFLGGVTFLYLWLVQGRFDGLVDALSWWGCSYSTLYADFLFVFPFCIIWTIRSVKEKKVNVECIVLTVFFLYAAVLFVGNHFGKISAYYYFKMYSLLWTIAFMVVARTIVSMKKDIFVFSYIMTWGILFTVYIGSIEKKLPQEYNLKLVDLSEGVTSSDFFGLYDCNIVYGRRDKIHKVTKELYMEAAKLSVQTGQFIPYVGEYKDSEWTYFALAGLPHQDVLSGKNYGAAIETLKNYPYVLSVECEEPMINISRFLNTLPVVYENEAGKIYKVENVQTEQYRSDDINVDMILRCGLPKLERMGWVEQDEYVNSLQVIRRIDRLGLDQDQFLYPELSMNKIGEKVSHLSDAHYDNRKEIIFTGTSSQELQQVINEYPGAMIDIHSKRVELNETLVLRNNTAIKGNGVELAGNGLEYGFIGEDISDIYINGVCLEGNINYGIYLTDCNEVSIAGCKINGMQQKAVCLIGDTRGVNIENNEISHNSAGGVYLAGNVSDCLIQDNDINNNGGTSKWMSGIVLTGVVPEDKHNVWEAFDEEHNIPRRDSIYDQTDCPHDLLITDNRISNNNSIGIYSDGAYKGYVSGNTLFQNNGGAITLEYGSMGFYLDGNYCESNGASIYPGIALDNAAYNILRNNIITDHCIGIKMVQASVRNLIMENVVQGGEDDVCHQYAIEVGTGTDEDEDIDTGAGYENIICRNNIMGNHETGIFIDRDCYVNDVFDNMIMEVRTYSIETVSHMFNSIINNTSNSDERNEYQQ